MLRYFLAFLPIIATFLSGCATSRLDTPSGRPEVTIAAPRGQVKSALIETFLGTGFDLRNETDSSMLFVRRMDSGDAVLYKTLLGNSYSSHPEWEIRVAMADTTGGVHVFASASSVMQNAFGRVDRNDMTSGKSGPQLQAILESTKFRLEVGDAFLHRGKIGLGFANQVVTLLTSSGPAAKAGLRVGDRILSANGSPLNGDLVHDGMLITGDPGSTVELVVDRKGRTITIEVVRGPP